MNLSTSMPPHLISRCHPLLSKKITDNAMVQMAFPGTKDLLSNQAGNVFLKAKLI